MPDTDKALKDLVRRLLEAIAADPSTKEGGPSQGNLILSALGFLLVEGALSANVPLEHLVKGVRTQYEAQKPNERVFTASQVTTQ